MNKCWFRKENVIPLTAYVVIFTVFILVMVFWHPGQQQTAGSFPDTPESAASAAPTLPDLPESAQQPTREGAEAFLDYFVEVFNYTMATGDTTTFKSIMAETSGFRAAAIKAAEEGKPDARKARIKTSIVRAEFVGDPPMFDSRIDLIVLGYDSFSDSEPRRRAFIAKWRNGRWIALGLTSKLNSPQDLKEQRESAAARSTS